MAKDGVKKDLSKPPSMSVITEASSSDLEEKEPKQQQDDSHGSDESGDEAHSSTTQSQSSQKPMTAIVEPPAHSIDKAEGFGASLDNEEMNAWLDSFASGYAKEFEKQIHSEREKDYKRVTTFGFTDLAPFARNAFECLVSDSFTQCFESQRSAHWIFKFYLIPLYFIGVIFRYGILLPARIIVLLIGFSIYLLIFLLALAFNTETKNWLHFQAIWILANSFLMSWCAVLREHGTVPAREQGQIFVANHTTVFDVVLLLGSNKFSLTGQAHPGFLGFFQNYVLACMGNLWFDRLASRDRAHVAKKIKEHAADVSKPPLLVFPEGTCVNNEYVVMFKRGAFELGTSIAPVAIRYNKVFVDAFWNSKRQSIVMHLYHYLTSWALVADVYYLEPQYRRPNESSAAFALRVKEMIANKAGLKSVHWDGYLKYFKPKPEMKAHRQKLFAKYLLRRFELDEDSLKAKRQADANRIASLVPPTTLPQRPAKEKRRRSISESVKSNESI